LVKGPDPIHRLIKIPLGRLDDWPAWAKILLPLACGAVLWWSLSWWLNWLQLCPAPVSMAHRIEQALVIGLAGYLVWKFPLVAVLLLHLLSSYIYFGKHPIWNYVVVAAHKLLQPLKTIPLRAGRVDFAPLLALALVFFAAEFAGRGLILLYSRLPF
ncbi:MAG TPA: hypothetical protein VFF11_17270, partial [Candidatus Binatia bacterium]|nr:hypothetical protein [Candidatus Binatia bacterium]